MASEEKPARKPTPKEAKMMTEIEKALGSDFISAEFLREHSIYVTVKAEAVRKAVDWMKQEWGLTHLSSITGMDLRGELAVIYHFEVKAVSVSLHIQVPTSHPDVDSITPLIPGATLYEREVHDLLGVKFKDHPNLKRLILPEDWPKDVYPLRKDWESPRLDKKEE
ncbi:MAG: NADH-quinone oxidoreductase subunit C [Candidatus Hodarchaeota archaeon]